MLTGIRKIFGHPLYGFVSSASKIFNILIPGALFVCGCGGVLGTSWLEHKVVWLNAGLELVLLFLFMPLHVHAKLEIVRRLPFSVQIITDH
jgi:hypothetical protein